MARAPRKPHDPVEIIARAMCRIGDPDETDATGRPLWKMYVKEAERAWAALGKMGLALPTDWNAAAPRAVTRLPVALRDYIHRLETHADPALTLQENAALKAQVEELEAALAARPQMKNPRR